MRSAIPRVLFAALVLALGLQLFSPVARTAHADEPCTTRGDNLTRNGSVTDGGYDTAHGVVINSWNAFLMGGEWPGYDPAACRKPFALYHSILTMKGCAR